MQQKQFVIRRGITDNYPRQLILDENFLKFENKDLRNNEFTTFQKNEIAEYSFGVKWMRYKFVFGREYVISIRNYDNQVLKINFKTYFGRKKKEYHQLCNAIIDRLWDCYFDEMTSNFIRRQEAGEEFKIGEVVFNPKGLTINSHASLRQKSVLIPWEKVATKSYATYFAIYSIDDAINVNRGFSYLNDWNTIVLYSAIETILKRKKARNN
jgi:hypothetical protein